MIPNNSPVWPLHSTDPRNRIGIDIIADIRRTKLIVRGRVGNSSQYLTMRPIPDNYPHSRIFTVV